MAVSNMNRREAIKAGAAAAAVTTIGVAQDHSHAPLLAPQTVAKMGAAWKPATLSEAQNQTVVILTDLIIPATDTPGAKAAMVNRYIDLFLTNGSAQEKDRFIAGLKWLDDYTTKEHGQPFAKLDAGRQVAVLEKLDAAENDTALAEGNRFFRQVKSATSRFYYSTEIGFKELNKNGVGTLGCKHPEHKAPKA